MAQFDVYRNPRSTAALIAIATALTRWSISGNLTARALPG
jgi:hypothetical protein